MSDARHWLDDALVYEIYPQSFADTGGDGIGDLPGVIDHLDHLAGLGVDVIWFNPCFASPFRDAGYDVSDYLRIAPRYGTNDDLVELVRQARGRGIRVLLDLVAGHTSVDHEWFRASCADPQDDRYVWADRPAPGYVPSPGPRPGYYLKNFYDEQPALNFGFARTDPDQPWREPVDAPGPLANRAALREVMAFWLDRGVSGFRVDMAYSLVKDDADWSETVALWREMNDWLASSYPDAVLLPESHEPMPRDVGIRCGFAADFFLVIHGAHSALFNNGGAGTLPWLDGHDHCYFSPEERPEGVSALRRFLDFWDAHRAAAGADRRVVLTSSDHDFSRLVTGERTAEQLGPVFAFLLTWGSVPSVYYGDEIGMRYVPGLPDHEGSQWRESYNRSGCRTPMQWDDALPNAGFSDGPADRLYLPIDPSPQRPTVAAQLGDPDSPLETLRRLISLRRETPALRAGAATEVLHAGYPLVYRRGGSHVVVVNPLRTVVSVEVEGLAGGRLLEGRGVDAADSSITAGPFSYGIFALALAAG